MKHILLFLGMLPLCLMAQEKRIVYDGLIEVRQVGSFSEIQVDGGIDVYYSPDNKVQVVASASKESYRNMIVTEVVGNRLRIYASQRWNSSENRKMKVYVSSPTLNKIIANGASDVYVQGVITEKTLNVQLGGASDFSGGVKVDELWIQQSGSSDVNLSGQVKTMHAQLSGASDLKAFPCSVDRLYAKASGASSIQITVNGEMELDASGASDIIYRGKGVVRKQQTSGASDIKSAGNE